jgi:hypothetical protein
VVVGRGRRLVRIDGAGGTHELIAWLTAAGCPTRSASPCPTASPRFRRKLAAVPDDVWTPAYDADGQVRPGAWVAEMTGLFDLPGWSPGMRLIVRKERPHPGAQLRITDLDGHRITAFSHLHDQGSAGRAGAAAPRPAPRRGPHPQRQ